jgi:hypothetical protein
MEEVIKALEKDVRIPVELPDFGWWLPAVCALVAVSSVALLCLGVVPLAWDSQSAMILGAIACLTLSIWRTRPRSFSIELTTEAITRTAMPGYHHPSYYRAFRIGWDELRDWSFVQEEDEEGVIRDRVELHNTFGYCYRQDRRARQLAEELRLRVPMRERHAETLNEATMRNRGS